MQALVEAARAALRAHGGTELWLGDGLCISSHGGPLQDRRAPHASRLPLRRDSGGNDADFGSDSPSLPSAYESSPAEVLDKLMDRMAKGDETIGDTLRKWNWRPLTSTDQKEAEKKKKKEDRDRQKAERLAKAKEREGQREETEREDERVEEREDGSRNQNGKRTAPGSPDGASLSKRQSLLPDVLVSDTDDGNDDTMIAEGTVAPGDMTIAILSKQAETWLANRCRQASAPAKVKKLTGAERCKLVMMAGLIGNSEGIGQAEGILDWVRWTRTRAEGSDTTTDRDLLQEVQNLIPAATGSTEDPQDRDGFARLWHAREYGKARQDIEAWLRKTRAVRMSVAYPVELLRLQGEAPVSLPRGVRRAAWARTQLFTQAYPIWANPNPGQKLTAKEAKSRENDVNSFKYEIEKAKIWQVVTEKIGFGTLALFPSSLTFT